MSRIKSLEKEFIDVNEFHLKFDVPMHAAPSLLNDEAYNFRLGFLHEELNEFVDAHHQKDLGTAIDSLIDLVYVSNGTALMMGFGVEDWRQLDESTNPIIDDMIEGLPGGPSLLDGDNYNIALSDLRMFIFAFVGAHAAGDIQACLRALQRLSLCALFHALVMGCSKKLWDELWDDVQRANMTKVRATSAEQSKRKSTLDVIKPAGWVGPRTNEIIAKYV
jgi:predicted HAD superfamily Cof-like phosphohydrolase